MKKEIVSLLLSGSMLVFSLSGCGGTSTDPVVKADAAEETVKEEIEQETEQKTEQETQEAVAESAKAKKIRQILKDTEFYDLADVEALKPYYEAAETRKNEILNTPTKIVKSDTFIPGETYTGNAYYIDPAGNDENDGLSPETAWRTFMRTTWGDVQPGDAVFLKRGEIFRSPESALPILSEVTYSAYGEGSKPVVTRVPENSAKPEYWSLYYEGEDGTKIWQYHEDLGDVAGIVFDDESYASRVTEWPTPEGWAAVEIKEMDPVHGISTQDDPCSPVKVVGTGEYRTIEENLPENLNYITRVDLTDLEYPWDPTEEFHSGPLYLRCDEGNPGELYKDIEILSLLDSGIFSSDLIVDAYGADGYVLDNLSVKYYITNAVCGGLFDARDAVIQNCTFEFGGNRLHTVWSQEPTSGGAYIGDGIYCVANNVTIRDNYMRHGGEGCMFESGMDAAENMGTYTVTGNLMENCGEGIRIFLWNEDEVDRFEKIIIQDNYILNSGDSMNNCCFEEPLAMDLGWEAVRYAKEFDVSNNVMLGSTMSMLRIPPSFSVDLNLHDNVIAQSRDGILMNESQTGGVMTWYLMSDILGE